MQPAKLEQKKELNASSQNKVILYSEDESLAYLAKLLVQAYLEQKKYERAKSK